MRALTLHPHWAHAVAFLAKQVENRARPIPKAHVGQRIAIHAGARLPKDWEGDVDRWPGAPYIVLTEHGGGPGRTIVNVGVDSHRIATRAIVATAVIRPHEPDAADWLRARFEASRPSNPARSDGPPLPAWADPTAAHWWALDDVRTLAEPVPVARGQLGLWRMDADTIAAVARQGG